MRNITSNNNRLDRYWYWGANKQAGRCAGLMFKLQINLQYMSTNTKNFCSSSQFLVMDNLLLTGPEQIDINSLETENIP